MHILSEARASVAWPSWARVFEDRGGVAGITHFCVYTLHRWDGDDGGLQKEAVMLDTYLVIGSEDTWVIV